MNSPDQCPFCGSRHLIGGMIVSSKGHGFKPHELQSGFIFTLRSPWAIHLKESARMCAECCVIWLHADPADAAKFLGKYAADRLKAELSTIQVGAKAEP